MEELKNEIVEATEEKEIEKTAEASKSTDKTTIEKRKKHSGKKKKRRKAKHGAARYAVVFYYAALGVVAAAVIIVMQYVNKELVKYLEDYETSLPKYEVERIFDTYFASPNFDSLLDMVGYELGEYDKKEDIVNCLNEETDGKEITWVYVAGTDKTKINVKADGKKFASFTVAKQEYPDEYGIYKYELGGIKLFYEAAYDVNVLVPFDCSVTVNGKNVGEEYVTEKDITDDERLNIPEGTYKLTYTRYAIKKLMAQPSVEIKDADGNTVQAVYDEEKNEYSTSFEYSEELKSEYEAYILEGMKLYARRMQADAEFSQCKKYFEEGTDLYKQIKANPGSFVWEHDGYKFEDEYTGEYYAYGDTVFRCHVKFNHILEKKWLEDHPDLVDMYVYLRLGDDGVYRIFAMETL